MTQDRSAHRVPLSSLALDLLEQARDLAGASPWLFPSPSCSKPITPHSINRALGRTVSEIGVEDMVPHDLRRTAASGMTSLGISRLTVSKILNHVESHVTARYDRYGYDAEKRHALDAWGAHLEGLLSDEPASGKVVSLATAGERR